MNLPKRRDVDLYREAFDHADRFAKAEVDLVRQNYTRFFQFISFVLVAATAFCTWFGVKTQKDIQTRVDAQVSKVLPEYTNKAVADQFDRASVQSTVHKMLSDEVQQDIDKLVNDRLAAAVDAAIARRQADIEKRVARAIPETIGQISSSTPAPYRGSTLVPDAGVQPKALTQQAKEIGAGVLRTVPAGICMIVSHGDTLSKHYASDIQQMCEMGNWRVIRKDNAGYVYTVPSWIRIVAKTDSSSVVKAGVEAFETAKIPFSRENETVSTDPEGKPVRRVDLLRSIYIEVGAPSHPQ